MRPGGSWASARWTATRSSPSCSRCWAAQRAETQILGTTAEGERVAVESRGNFEFDDGRAYRNSYHHLFIVSDGQVRAVREYLDLAVVQKFLGLAPAAA